MWDPEAIALATRLTARLSAALYAGFMFACGVSAIRLHRGSAWRPRLFGAFVVTHSVHFSLVLVLAAATRSANIAARGGWVVTLASAVVFYAVALALWRGELRRARTADPARPGIVHFIAVVVGWILFFQAYALRVDRSSLFGVWTLLLAAALVAYVVGWLGSGSDGRR